MKKWTQSRVSDLQSLLRQSHKKLLIWDFDKTLVDLDWFGGEPVEIFFDRVYQRICAIDERIIDNKQAFFDRLFPYPEIDAIVRRYGSDAAKTVKAILFEKERQCMSSGTPEQLLLDFISDTHQTYDHAIWSNNHQDTISYYVQKNGIAEHVGVIASYDQVSFAKPHPEGFEMIAKRYPTITQGDMLIIGDSPRSDQVAANAVGVDFFLWADTNAPRV